MPNKNKNHNMWHCSMDCGYETFALHQKLVILSESSMQNRGVSSQLVSAVQTSQLLQATTGGSAASIPPATASSTSCRTKDLMIIEGRRKLFKEVSSWLREKTHRTRSCDNEVRQS